MRKVKHIPTNKEINTIVEHTIHTNESLEYIFRKYCINSVVPITQLKKLIGIEELAEEEYLKIAIALNAAFNIDMNSIKINDLCKSDKFEYFLNSFKARIKKFVNKYNIPANDYRPFIEKLINDAHEKG